MRMGISDRLLSKDYDTFKASFYPRLDHPQVLSTQTRLLMEEVKASTLSSPKSYFLVLFLYMGLAVGVEILPECARQEYMSVLFKTWYGYIFQKFVVWLVWLFYPILNLLPPLRATLCFLLLLERSSWPIFLVSCFRILWFSYSLLFKKSCSEMLSIDPVEGTPTRKPGDATSVLQWLAMDSAISGKSCSQSILVLVLDVQLASQKANWMIGVFLWMSLIPRLVLLFFTSFYWAVRNFLDNVRTLTGTRRVLHENIKVPRHGVYCRCSLHQCLY